MPYRTLYFDLDETIYDRQCGLWNAISLRITQYMVERAGLPEEDVPSLRRVYYERYGTTLRGLMYYHHVNPDDYLAYVHDLPLADYIQPVPALRTLLLGLKRPKWIFTNADVAHAQRVLKIMEISDCFEGIIDVRAMDFSCKPEPEAFLKALKLSGEVNAHGCVLLDDSLKNLITARQLGFTTVMVGPDGHQAADYSIPSLLSLPKALPEFWK